MNQNLSYECRSSGCCKVRSAHGSVDVVRGFYTIFSGGGFLTKGFNLVPFLEAGQVTAVESV